MDITTVNSSNENDGLNFIQFDDQRETTDTTFPHSHHKGEIVEEVGVISPHS